MMNKESKKHMVKPPQNQNNVWQHWMSAVCSMYIEKHQNFVKLFMSQDEGRGN